MPELILILLVALIVVGPSKLPDLAKSLGKGLSEFRKATDDIKSQLADNETFQDLQGLKNQVQDTVNSIKPTALLDPEIKPKPAADQAPVEIKKFEAPSLTPEVLEDQAPLEPKAPRENLEARMTLMDGIILDQNPASPQAASVTPAPSSAAAAVPDQSEKTKNA